MRNLLFVSFLFLSACKVEEEKKTDQSSLVKKIYDTSVKKSIHVSWAKSKESRVNMVGGGYRVYYSKNSNFDIVSANFVNIPAAAGSPAPNFVEIRDLSKGTYYVKVQAYYQEFRSKLSSEVAIVVP